MRKVFKEALKEIPQPVEQHPFGMGGLELHVVAEHRGELLGVHLAVVGPGGLIVVAGLVVPVGRRMIQFGWGRLGLTEAWASDCVSTQGGIAEIAAA